MLKQKNFGKSTLIGALLLFITMAASCELFSEKPDIDVESAIDAKVKEANAAVINVEVQEGGTGIASPNGNLLGIKLGVPFKLTFTSFNDFGFLGWQASLDETIIATWERNALTGVVSETGKDRVQFVPGNTSGSETSITVNTDPGNTKLLIEPRGVDRPRVVDVKVAPLASGNTYYVRNPYVQITFSRPIAHSSIVFYEGWNSDFDNKSYNPGWTAGTAVKFNNVEIHSETRGINLERFYAPPHLSPDGLRLLLRPYVQRVSDDVVIAFRDGEYLGGGIITVTLGRGVTDTQGIAMGQKHSFIFVADSSVPYGSGINSSDPKPLIGRQNSTAIKAEDFHGPDTPKISFAHDNTSSGIGFASELIFSDTSEQKIYTMFQCSETLNVPITGLRVYEFGSAMHGDGKYYYIGDFPLLSDANPALARQLEERAFPLIGNAGDTKDITIPVHAVEITIPSRGGKYPTVLRDDSENKRKMSLYYYPLTGYDTILSSNEVYKDDLENRAAGPPNAAGNGIRLSMGRIGVRYFE